MLVEVEHQDLHAFLLQAHGHLVADAVGLRAARDERDLHAPAGSRRPAKRLGMPNRSWPNSHSASSNSAAGSE